MSFSRRTSARRHNNTASSDKAGHKSPVSAHPMTAQSGFSIPRELFQKTSTAQGEGGNAIFSALRDSAWESIKWTQETAWISLGSLYSFFPSTFFDLFSVSLLPLLKLLAYPQNNMFSFKLCSMLAAAVVAVVASPMPRQGGAAITQCNVPNTAAITFDDGPWQWTREIVDTLASKNAKGTFFVNGNNYGCIYDDMSVDHLRYAYERGHQVASHTWSHAHLDQLSKDQTWDEMNRVNEALGKIIGATPTAMRPPYGGTSDDVFRSAGELGLTVVNWNYDSGDAAGQSPDYSLGQYYAAAADSGRSIIILNHETVETTPHQVLGQAIDVLQQAGYNLVTVAECLGMAPYTNQKDYGSRDGSWTC
ncbi:carbohydrate esterase family 4 protein [Cylindrobasidium torrendii FP15055 ss-10]|uniref:Carbohydrate esterase family 4 protein n=1 Tax=Cylindrobasidium torrendii FP15055 ss-10 TaxID=1314674 RepID=A0A0D7BA86_9AGAR|nr:carbohydrate esterase family 4 protein [Cylindrobasidium torrendii FP15055 ss-10]